MKKFSKLFSDHLLHTEYSRIPQKCIDYASSSSLRAFDIFVMFDILFDIQQIELDIRSLIAADVIIGYHMISWMLPQPSLNHQRT